MEATVVEIAALVGGEVVGRGDLRIAGVASLMDALERDLSFLGNPKYLPALRTSRAGCVLVPADFAEEIAAAAQIRVANPSLAFAAVVERFAPKPVAVEPGIHPTAVIAESATVGKNVTIQAHVVIEPGAVIGDGTHLGAGVYVGHETRLGADCKIYPNVTLRERCVLGDRVIIHSGTVLGSDGFGFEMKDGRYVKIAQVGIVQVDHDVEIGANVTIDRARFGRTWIGEGTKIDNLVQIAHNVVIGKHSIVVSQVGISGSSKIGNYVTLAGQAGIVGHLEIGDQAIIAAQSGVTKNVPAKEMWLGSPAAPVREEKERLAYINRIPKLIERIKRLEERP